MEFLNILETEAAWGLFQVGASTDSKSNPPFWRSIRFRNSWFKLVQSRKLRIYKSHNNGSRSRQSKTCLRPSHRDSEQIKHNFSPQKIELWLKNTGYIQLYLDWK